MRLRLAIATVAAIALVALAPAGASAAAGELDPSFGTGGSERLFGADPKIVVSGAAVAPDDSIVLVGVRDESVFVAKMLPSGALDPSFGEGGIVTTTLASGEAYGEAAVVQPNGKIVVVGLGKGESNDDFLVARYEPNGSLDTGFGGGDGVALLPVGKGIDTAKGVALGVGGRILVAGEAEVSGEEARNAAAAVLLPDGEPDKGFAGDGTRTIPLAKEKDSSGAVAVVGQPDGRIVLAVSTGSGGGPGFVIVRLLADSAFDPSFDEDGIVTKPVSGTGEGDGGRVEDVALQPDGRIVAAGYGFAEMASSDEVAAMRFLADGSLDPGFGGAGTGIFTRDLGVGDDAALNVVVDAAGRILLGGGYGDGTNPESTALLRLGAAGLLDPTFGTGGVALRGVTAPSGEYFEDGALDSAGRYVLVSHVYEGGGLISTGVARFLGDPPPAPTPSPAGPLPAPSPAPPADTPPTAKLKKIAAKVAAARLKGFSGTAGDADGGTVAKVQIALELLPTKTPKAGASRAVARAAKVKTKSCLALRSARVRFKSSRVKRDSACPRRWLDASGTAKWKFALRAALPPGRYVVYARALSPSGATESSFSRAAGDRIAFRVLP